MKTKSVLFGGYALLLLLGASVAVAAEDSLTTAVFAKLSNGYHREKMPDGTFKPEYYALSNGGYSPGVGKDASIDAMPFPTIAGVVAQHLAAQKYFLAKDSKSADLLLVIQWGASIPFDNSSYQNALTQLGGSMNALATTRVEGPTQRGPDGIQSDASAVAQVAESAFDGDVLLMQMNNTTRAKANERNARLLGYMKEINTMNDDRRYAGAGTYYDDLISDIEEKRYYVIVSAYDFRAAVQGKEKKLLWTTRVSIQAQGNRFDERLMTMMANASRQFGQESGRLIRQFQRAPRVDLKELKFLGVVPDAAPNQAPVEGK